jgi:hypothetical protein
MEFTPEIASSLDIFADETTAFNDKNQILEVQSQNPEIKRDLETLFFDIVNIEFNIWSWVRNLCKYGDFVLFVDANEQNGILNLLPIPINEIEREEGYDKEDPFAVRFRWLTQGNMILENWQVVHFRLLGNDNFLPYGSSIIEPARRIWRQLILIEDAMLVYRIVRSPERRVFKIDVGNVAPDQIESFMEQIKTKLRRNQIVDPTSGQVDLRYNPLSVDEDYFIPVRGDKSSDITTLAGGQFTGDIEDVQYIQNKLFAALKIPKAYLSYEGELGSKATLAQQDVRFSRTIERVQKIVVAELNKIAIIHLFLLGYNGPDLVDFQIKLANASTIAEQQKLELWRMRFEIAGTAQEGMLDRETIYRRLFNMNSEEIEKIREGRVSDRLEDLTLDGMQAPTEEGEPGGAEGGAEEPEKVPGEEELPQTLGGEEGGAGAPPEGGEAAPAPEGVANGPLLPEGSPTVGGDEGAFKAWDTQLPQDFDRNQAPKPRDDEREPPKTEKKNMGSTGNRAELAVDKGKDLFAPAEKQHLSAASKKQTSKDPYDLRAIKRMIGRPFSERIVMPKKSKTLNERLDLMLESSGEHIDDVERDIESSISELKKLVK